MNLKGPTRQEIKEEIKRFTKDPDEVISLLIKCSGRGDIDLMKLLIKETSIEVYEEIPLNYMALVFRNAKNEEMAHYLLDEFKPNNQFMNMVLSGPILGTLTGLYEAELIYRAYMKDNERESGCDL